MYNKKAINVMTLVSVIIAIITLLIISMQIYNYNESSKYTDSVIACTTFVNGINGKPTYFDKSLDRPTKELENSLKNLCASKTVKIGENNLKPAAELIKDCYSKMGNGKDFLGANVENLNFCLYCGKIAAEKEINFKEKLNEELKNEQYKKIFENSTQTTNINEITIKEASPEKISEDTIIEVYYYIQRSEAQDIRNKLLNWFSANIGSKLELLNWIFAENKIETFTAVRLFEQENYKESTSIDEIKHSSELNCNIIIPDKNYD